jgi:sulfonate transport system permease protein
MPTRSGRWGREVADTDTLARLDAELAGLDALEIPLDRKKSRGARIWASLWPKLLATAIFFGVWQIVVWSGWKPEFLLPPPSDVFTYLFDNFDTLLEAAGNSMVRAIQGFAIAMVIGVVVGALVARNRILRAAIGSMITGLQTMPSIAWFPLAILLFKLTEGAIIFVVVIGAAPSIANGLINGIDNIPPLLLRAGRVLGARGWRSLFYVVLPAALPSFVGGLKQGWAFAWRSLLAGELLVLISGKHTLGEQLEFNRQFADATGVVATMMVIFLVGVVVDALFFGNLDRYIRRRFGLIEEAQPA